MIRIRLFLSILTICFVAGSSPVVERAKREADGKIPCYIDEDFQKIENVSGVNCGYSFKSFGKGCANTVLVAHNKFDFDKVSNIDAGKDKDGIVYASVKCKCEGDMCNEKEKLPDCLGQAAAIGSIETNQLAPDQLDEIIGCAMGNHSLTYEEFLYLHTTTTTTTSTTTTTMPSAANENNTSFGALPLAVLCVVVLLGFGGLVVFCCIKHFSKKSERNGKAVESGEKKKPKSIKSKDTVTTTANMSTVSPTKIIVSPADATVTPAKTTASQKTSEDGKVTGVEKPKRESKVESAIKSNPGSIVKSEVKSVGQSSISTDSDAPRDITGLLATVYKIIKTGAQTVFDELDKERKRINDSKHKDIEWIELDKEKPNKVVINRKCVVDLKLRHPIVKEFNKAQKGRKASPINANFVDEDRKVIVSESPAHQNMTDFLLLLYLYEVCAAISVMSFTDVDDGTGYVPEEKVKTFGCFTLRKVKSQQITGLISVNEIEIYLNGANPRKFVSIQLMTMGYDKFETYDHAARMLDYIQRHISSKISYKTPILFHCADGSDNSSSMAMLHKTISACSTQKQAVNYIAIFEEILCARKEAIKTRASLVFVFRVFIDYARHLNVIKAYELGTWRRDVEDLMKRVLEEDKKE